MTATKEGIEGKLLLRQPAERRGHVSRVRQNVGYHGDAFYKVPRAFQDGGAAVLVAERRGPKDPLPTGCTQGRGADRALSPEHPAHGARGIANELRLGEVNVSPLRGAARGVWPRHHLESRYKRLLGHEPHAQDATIILSDQQVWPLERSSCECRMRHLETHTPGELLNQDAFFYWGTPENVGKPYDQLVTNPFGSLAQRPRSTPRRYLSPRPTSSTTGYCLATRPWTCW